ncbi:ATP-binding protein [Acidaminobacter sp. JC074]|uniref:ATP-binding protein n=1 Tax=Acidaminobacter sp. JC074 TaxID=2530199 RepID=UPI001F0F382F|nr:ATP-binding protein [Acidaminobacter sp. JC074]MCH4887093.1 ATP-binding protein [Acidaminobacter sp. JC074]
MFLAREKEMMQLERFYQSNKFEMIIMYGRRRVGKTKLITEFIKDKNAIFYVAEENNDLLNKNKFTRTVLSHYKMDLNITFEYWEDIFKFISTQAGENRLILVIDELPYLAKANTSFLSILQNIIDHQLSNKNIMIILCGSSISFMENELVSHKSPIYGRKTGQMKIYPMNYMSSQLFFPEYSVEDKFKTFSILGGIPHYMIQFDPSKTFVDNVIEKCLNNTTLFYDEPRNLLHQELRTPVVYYAIIEAIANGASKLNEIATKIGESSSKTSKYILSLLELEIIKKIQPIGASNSKKSIYHIADPLYVFMFKYVYNHRSLIEQDLGPAVWEMKISENIGTLYGLMFEKVCTQYLIKKNQTMDLPFLVEVFGSWWGSNPVTKTQEEIDIVGLSKDSGIYCECKFKNEKVGIKVYEKLIERSLLINRENKYYYIFSKSGFTKELLKLEEQVTHLKLVTLDNLYE